MVGLMTTTWMRGGHTHYNILAHRGLPWLLNTPRHKELLLFNL